MIYYQWVIRRFDLRMNPTLIYVFGDNHSRRGLGGQAKAMRGEDNAIGIRTKKTTTDCFVDTPEDWTQFTEGLAEDIEKLKEVGGWTGFDFRKNIVFPSDGIGTGLANLPLKMMKHLNEALLDIGIKNGVTQ